MSTDLVPVSAQEDSKQVQAIVGCFKGLKSYADFHADPTEIGDAVDSDANENDGDDAPAGGHLPNGLALGYTINLHLPATSDVAVFNAIFKSLREHLLR